jgi:hypothetical protein
LAALLQPAIGRRIGTASHSKPVAKHPVISKYYSALMRAQNMRALRAALKKKTSWSRKLACCA